jgi:hypothetical protein
MKIITKDIKVRLHQLTYNLKEELTEFVGEPITAKLKAAIQDKAITLLQNSDINSILFNDYTKVILKVDRYNYLNLSHTLEEPLYTITFDMTNANAWIDLTEGLAKRLRRALTEDLIGVQINRASVGSKNTSVTFHTNKYHVRVGEKFINISTLDDSNQNLSTLAKNPVVDLVDKVKLDWSNFYVNPIEWFVNQNYTYEIIGEIKNRLTLTILKSND